MAATANVSKPDLSRKSLISKSGVLTIYGFGVRLRMQSGHLEIEDGIGPERRLIRLPRVNHRLKRVVCIADDGFVTLDALRWLSNVGASFTMLDRLGRIRVITGPTSPSEAKLRRAQAVALGNGVAVNIARELISAKLNGEETLAREKLQNVETADTIAALRARLADAADLNAIRGIESRAAAEYWSAWRDLPILFPRKDAERVPTHWLTFGPRHSPLTGGPRLSINPPNSLLNYANAIAESECRLAACACGLDPGLGLLHTDTANRDSLALDLIEPIRPAIEAWLLDWLMCEPLRRSDFFETGSGNCRLMSSLCSHLSETAPTWGRLVAPWAEYVAHTLWAGRSSSSRPPTRLTQRHKREAKGRASLPPALPVPKRENFCRACGKTIRDGRSRCAKCAIQTATEHMLVAAQRGREVAYTPEARAKQAETQRRNAIAQHAWNPKTQPPWLTHRLYSEKIQPLLARVSSSSIAKQIGVSRQYASLIRKGYLPHPRHWHMLAGLVGLST